VVGMIVAGPRAAELLAEIGAVPAPSPSKPAPAPAGKVPAKVA